MAKKNQINFSKFFFLIGQIVIGIRAIESNHNQFEKELFYIRNFDVSRAINEILTYNWTKNQECLNEINAIKSGIENHEEWAIRGKLDFFLSKR